MSQPVVNKIRRINGVAGQITYVATVSYPDEPSSPVRFVGSVYGGPIVMCTTAAPGGTIVVDPGRFGARLSPRWVRNFFAPPGGAPSPPSPVAQ